MKKFLVSRDHVIRDIFCEKRKSRFFNICIYNTHIPCVKFDMSIKLTELYNDEIFLRLLSKIDSNTHIFLFDLGIDYCSFKADYIKPFTKLNPICMQAGETFIVDQFAFYNTEKSIYRPLLYIDDLILNSTVQEFYNSKGFESFDGNKIENYYSKLIDIMDMQVRPLDVEVINYEPTESEKNDYNALKEDLILNKKLPKQKIISELHKFIKESKSRCEAIKVFTDSKILNITENTNKSRVKMYSDIMKLNPNKLVFYSSGFYGIDEIELSRTKDAILRHNELILLINGK